MFVSFWPVNVRKVEKGSRMQHRMGKSVLLGLVHSAMKNRHQQRRSLVIDNLTSGNAVHEVLYLFNRKRLAVALLPDNVLWSQLKCLGSFHQHNRLNGYGFSFPYCI